MAESDDLPYHWYLTVTSTGRERGFQISGEIAFHVSKHYGRANDAVQRVRAYCDRRRESAAIDVYNRSGKLYKSVVINPGWLKNPPNP